MRKFCIAVLLVIWAASSFAVSHCCSSGGQASAKSHALSPADDSMITVEQIEESIATLQRMKARIPLGQKGISVRELMAMELEAVKKRPEYAKMSEADRKRLDAAIDAARRPPATASREAGPKKPVVAVPSHETVELSDGSRAFFVPRRRVRSSVARKGSR